MKESHPYTKTYNIAIDLLKVMAMLLIINSHADVLFPPNLKFLATGGAIGNELFFLISGYLMHVSNNAGKDIYRRCVRLYVPVWMINVVYLLLGKEKIAGFSDFIRLFVWPTKFWFVSAIYLIMVLMIVLLQKIDLADKRNFIVFSFVILAADILAYIFFVKNKSVWIHENAKIFPFTFRYSTIYSLFVFALGYYIRKNKITGRRNSPFYLLLTFMSLIIFYGFEFLLHKRIVPMEFQIVTQPLTIFCVLSIFFLFTTIRVFENNAVHTSFIRLLSSITLEAYLVQFLIIGFLSKLNLAFPINYILCILPTILAAVLLNKIDNFLCKRLILLVKS